MRLRPFWVGVVYLALAPGAAGAVPLDSVACDAAKREQSDLTDVPAVLERGADWGKANASRETLARVARWIELQESLSFRCGRGVVTDEAKRAAAAAELIENPPPPPAPAAAVPVPANGAPAAAAQAKAPAAAASIEPAGDRDGSAMVKPKPKAKPKPKPKPDAADGGFDAPLATVDTQAAPKKKRAPKADAFVPPGTTQAP